MAHLVAILFRARHGKQNVCFVLGLSLIKSDLAWLGLAPSQTVKIRTLCVFTEYVCVCVSACVYICGKGGGGEVEDDRMAILLF